MVLEWGINNWSWNVCTKGGPGTVVYAGGAEIGVTTSGPRIRAYKSGLYIGSI